MFRTESDTPKFQQVKTGQSHIHDGSIFNNVEGKWQVADSQFAN